tara:strand:- start:669 stop:1049 length:381 start_codon:yes stop_codon:yes gene_type:complete
MIQIGEMRRGMGKRCQRRIDEIVNTEKRWDEYYIIIRAYHDKSESLRTGLNVIRTKLMVTPKVPHAWVGTMGVYVNRKKGQIEYHHCLPVDTPAAPDVEFDGDHVETVADSVARYNSPIVWAESVN